MFKDKFVVVGLIFEMVDKLVFCKVFSDSGFYKIWKEKLGVDVWKVLESIIGDFI